MFHDVTIGQYIPGNSLMHRLDPRVKLILCCAVMLCLFIVQRLDVLSLFGLGLLALCVSSSLPLSFMLRGLKVVWLLCLLTFVFNAFLTPGTTCCSFCSVSVTHEGVVRGAQMGIRLLLLVLLTSLVSLTTSPILLTDGVEKLLAPCGWVGIPSHELAMVSTIALRFVPTLASETERIVKAQMARGASLDRGGLYQRMKAMLPVLVPLFVSAFRYAEDLAVAMEARCYRGGGGRTRLRELRMTVPDVSFGVVCFAVMVGLVFLDRWLASSGISYI